MRRADPLSAGLERKPEDKRRTTRGEMAGEQVRLGADTRPGTPSGSGDLGAIDPMDEVDVFEASLMLAESMVQRSVRAVVLAATRMPGLSVFVEVEPHPVADYFAVYGAFDHTIWAVGKVDRERNQYLIEFARPHSRNAFASQPRTPRVGYHDFVTKALAEEVRFRLEVIQEFNGMSREEQEMVMRAERETPAPRQTLLDTNLFPVFRGEAPPTAEDTRSQVEPHSVSDASMRGGPFQGDSLREESLREADALATEMSKWDLDMLSAETESASEHAFEAAA